MFDLLFILETTQGILVTCFAHDTLGTTLNIPKYEWLDTKVKWIPK